MNDHRKWELDDTQRGECTPEELARMIFRFLKNDCQWKHIPLGHLQEIFCPKNEQHSQAKDRTFCVKFYEAVARLKLRGLLMDVSRLCFGNRRGDSVCLTSVGEKSEFDDGLLILIDDPYEIVQSLKGEIPNLDEVVEQYYLESLRTCQNGNYISSVICLGAASERTIKCLAEALVLCNPRCKPDIDSKPNISELTRHLADKGTELFKGLDSTLRRRLRERLEGLANIYRLNRNVAGHPESVPQDWRRDEQECYLSQFRRLAGTCFHAIDALNRGNTDS